MIKEGLIQRFEYTHEFSMERNEKITCLSKEFDNGGSRDANAGKHFNYTNFLMERLDGYDLEVEIKPPDNL